MQLKLENGSAKRYICDKCGFTDTTLVAFNPSDSIDGKDYCLKCHPIRMTYEQLIEWLAKGHGFLCQQAMDYCTAPTFRLSPVCINGRQYPGNYEDQIPYDEHELIVRCFDASKRSAYWEIPTLEMFNRDCRAKKLELAQPKKCPLLFRPFKAVFGFFLGFYLGLRGLELEDINKLDKN